jgi:hypothetical protein
MNADALTTRVAEGIAVITLGSARCIYFDAEMGDPLTDALEGFAGDPGVRVVVVAGGAPARRAPSWSKERESRSNQRRTCEFVPAPATGAAAQRPNPASRENCHEDDY